MAMAFLGGVCWGRAWLKGLSGRDLRIWVDGDGRTSAQGELGLFLQLELSEVGTWSASKRVTCPVLI